MDCNALTSVIRDDVRLCVAHTHFLKSRILFLYKFFLLIYMILLVTFFLPLSFPIVFLKELAVT